MGHGVALRDSPQLLQLVVDRRITIEVYKIQSLERKWVFTHKPKNFVAVAVAARSCPSSPGVSPRRRPTSLICLHDRKPRTTREVRVLLSDVSTYIWGCEGTIMGVELKFS